MKCRSPGSWLAVLLALGGSLVSTLADRNWTGAENNQWTTSANWSGGALPGSGDIVYYNASSAANLSNWLTSAFTIKGLAYSNAPTSVMPPNGIAIGASGTGTTLTIGGGGIDVSLASSNLTLTLPCVMGADQSWLVRSNQTLAFSNVVSGSGNLTNIYAANASSSAPGTIYLSGANTFTGELTVNGGRVFMANASALGNANSLAIVNSGGQINWSAGYAINKSFQANGSGLAGDGALRAGSGASIINGNITLLGNCTPLKMDSGASFTLNGLITGANLNAAITLDGGATSTLNGAVQLGAGSFTKASSATLVLNAPTNSWSGGTTITGGGLTVGTGNEANLGTGPILNDGTLTFNTLNDIAVNDAISGTGSLVQNGLSTLTLAGANTYSGNTTIGANSRINLSATGLIPNSYTNTITVGSGATLDVSAMGGYTLGSYQTLAGSGAIIGADTSAGAVAVTASPGAVITGTETIYGDLSAAAGAALYPGGSGAAGTIRVNGSMALNSAQLFFDLSSATTEGDGVNDEIVVAGDLSLAGTTLISIGSLLHGALPPGGVYRLIHYGGVLTGLGTFAFSQPTDGLSIDTASQPGYVLLVVASGPTPTLIWSGAGARSQWDVGVSSYWVTTNSEEMYIFVPFNQFDNVAFTDYGSASTGVPVVTPVKPASILVQPTSAHYTLSGPGKISGSSSLTLLSNVTFTIQTTNNDYSGPTIVQQGTLSIQDLGTFPASGGISISNGATVEFNVNVPASANGVNVGSVLLPSLVGTGTLLKDGTGTMNLGGQGSTAMKLNFKLSPGAEIEVANGTLRNGGWQGGVWTDGATWTNLSNLTVTSPGIFDIWDGFPVYVDALNGNGMIQIGINNLGAHYLYVGANNGSGLFTGSVSNNAGSSAIQVVKLGTGSQEIDRVIGVSAGVPVVTVEGGTLTLGGTNDNSFARAVVNAGAQLRLQKTSSSTVHSVGGGTSLTINTNGFAQITGTGNDQIYDPDNVQINAGGVLDLFGANETVGTVTGAGTVINGSAETASFLGVGGGNASGNLTVNLAPSALGLTLAKLGTGTITVLSTNLAQNGGIIVSNGVLQFGNGILNALPSSDVCLDGGTLSFVVATNTSATFNHNLTNSPGASGALAENGFGGTLYLGGSNTFLGSVNVSAGALWINNSSALGTTTSPKTVILTNGTSGQCSLHLNGTNGAISLPALFSLSTSDTSGALFNEAGNNVINGPITLTTGGGDTYLVVNGGTLTVNGLVAPNTTARNLRLGGPGNGFLVNGFIQDGNGANTLAGLIKQDAGTWTLEGNNTTTAATLVEGGALILGPQGTLANTANINVSSNAVFDVSQPAAYNGGFWTNNGKPFLGSGAITGSVALAASTLLQPGGAGVCGTLAFSNNLALGPAVTNVFDLGSSLTPGAGLNDLVIVGGSLDPQGAVVSINPGQPLATGAYQLLAYRGAHLSSFSPTVLNPTRYTVVLDETSATNEVLLHVSGAVSNLTWYGSGNDSWDVGKSQNWNTNTQVFYALDPVTFDDTAATGTVNLAVAVAPTSVTVNNSLTNYTFQGSGKLTGATGIAKSGAAALRINTANDFTGPVTVSAGVLVAGSATAFGATNGTVTIASGATLDVNDEDLGLKPFVVSGAGTNGAGAVMNSSPTRQLDALNTLTLAGDTVFGGVGGWDLRNNGVPFASLSTRGQPYNLTKVGANQVSLGSVMVDPALANIAVSAGTFSFEDNSTGLGNPTNTLTVSTNATLQLWAPTNQVNKLIVLNGGTNNSLTEGSGTATVVSPVTLNYTNLINVSGSALILDGPVTESTPGGIVKVGGGALTLAGTNAWSGSTVVAAGTLNLGNGGIGGNLGPGPLVLDGGSTLQFNRADDFAWTNDCSLGTNGTIIKLNTNTVTVLSTNLCAGNDQVNGGTLIIATNGFLTSGNQFWVAQDATTGACIVNGGTLISTNWIAAARSNTNALGTLTLNSGVILKTGPGNVIAGSLGGNGAITVNGGALSNNAAIWLGETANEGVGRLTLNGGLAQATQVTRAQNAGQSAIAQFNGGTLQATTNQLSFLTIDQALVQAGGLLFDDGGYIVTIAQPLIGDTNAPGGGLVKLGTGTLTLTATNTYTGATVVQAGTLVVSGSVAGPAMVAGGTLTGSGVIAGPLTVTAGGNLAPGTLLGTMTVGSNAVMNAGSTTTIEVNADWAINSQLTASAIAYGGTLAVENVGFTAFTNGMPFKLFDAAHYTGSFAAFSPPAPGPGLAWDAGSLTLNGTLKVAPAQPPVFAASTRLGGGQLQFNFSGSPGAAYRVWASTNAALAPITTTWTLVGNGTFGAGLASFVGHETNGAAFYVITCP